MVLCRVVGGDGGFGPCYLVFNGGVDGEGAIGQAFHAVGEKVSLFLGGCGR